MLDKQCLICYPHELKIYYVIIIIIIIIIFFFFFKKKYTLH